MAAPSMEVPPEPLAGSAAALSIDEVLKQVTQDDQEEWEYEYSTTETETYYLTIELSYPEFKDRPPQTPHHSRGGYHKKMRDRRAASSPSGGTASNKRRRTQKGGQGTEGKGNADKDAPEVEALGDSKDKGTNNDRSAQDEDDENENEDDDVDDDHDGPLLDPELLAASKRMETERRASEKKRQSEQKRRIAAEKEGAHTIDDESGTSDEADDLEKSQELDNIQIIDLHTDQPIIAYRGRVFEGQWAEMIGTEAVFARRSRRKPLPALRNLEDKVDVLAASSSRIVTQEKEVQRRTAGDDGLAAIRKEWNIRIPRGKNRTGERARQADFLERLIALKMKKGHTDHVTVYATDGAGKDWDDRRGPDYQPRVRRRAGHPAPTKGGVGAEGGQQQRKRRNQKDYADDEDEDEDEDDEDDDENDDDDDDENEMEDDDDQEDGDGEHEETESMGTGLLHRSSRRRSIGRGRRKAKTRGTRGPRGGNAGPSGQLSTPTPLRWVDLTRPQGGDKAGEAEGKGGEDDDRDDDGDVNMTGLDS